MLIYLNEIPKEGRHFTFTQDTGELNDSLCDLIAQQAFKVELDILPLGDCYDIQGDISTCTSLTCSFCANDYLQSITQKFHEILVEADKKTIKGYSDDQKWDDEEIGVSTIPENKYYNLGEFIHEMVAINIPFQPICKEDCKGLCQGCGHNLNEEECHCASRKKEKESPFSVLKSIKLN